MLNQVFDQVYIINLPERADRRAEMNDQLAKLGLGLSIEGLTLFRAVRPSDPGGFPSIGARGCFFSHLQILQHALEAGFQKILILEDDCNFTAALSQDPGQFVDLVNRSSWNLLYGGVVGLQGGRGGQNGVVATELPPDQGVMGTHFVAFDRRAIEVAVPYLLEMSQRPAGDPAGGPMHVDGAYSWMRAQHPWLITLMCSPQVAYQRSSKTDIHEARWYDRISFLGPVVAGVRKLKNAFLKG
jgi:glycosyl transferase, family 25